MSKCERSKSNWSEIISTFFNFLLLVIAIVGVIFVRNELKQITTAEIAKQLLKIYTEKKI